MGVGVDVGGSVGVQTAGERCQVVIHAIVICRPFVSSKTSTLHPSSIACFWEIGQARSVALGRGGSTLRRLLGAHACSRGTYLFLSQTLLTNVGYLASDSDPCASRLSCPRHATGFALRLPRDEKRSLGRGNRVARDASILFSLKRIGRCNT